METKNKKKSTASKSNVVKFPSGGNFVAAPERKKKDIPVKNKEYSLFRRHKSIFIITGIILFFVAAVIVSGDYIIKNYTITATYVEGNIHYTSEEIMDMVMEGRYGNNSIFLSLKYKDKSIEGIPFIEKMDVVILAPDTVKINVYEKALAGCIKYLGRYLYFDKDGIVVESSLMLTDGVPEVTGMYFDYIVLYEKLPVEDTEVFSRIMTITQMVNKYDINVDKIYFGTENEITLYFDDVKVALGVGENLEDKVMALQSMLPELEGKSGTLKMENYAEGTKDAKNITFKPDT